VRRCASDGSTVSSNNDERYALKVTPRQPTSKWSDINRNRWLELKAAGLLTSAGLAAAPTNNTYAPRPVIPDLPVYIAKALKANSKAWEFFRELAPTYRRHFVVWIHTAKRRETRERRIRESIALMAAGKKLGLKQTEAGRSSRRVFAARRQQASAIRRWFQLANVRLAGRWRYRFPTATCGQVIEAERQATKER
jgi:hypothetical protein